MILPKRHRVIVESPYAANDYYTVEQHKLYLHHAIADCLRRGEAPFASHLLLPEILSDGDQLERAIGTECGFAWGELADTVAVYSDLGVSPGMKAAIDHYKALGKEIDWRSIPHKVVQSIIDMRDDT